MAPNGNIYKEGCEYFFIRLEYKRSVKKLRDKSVNVV